MSPYGFKKHRGAFFDPSEDAVKARRSREKAIASRDVCEHMQAAGSLIEQDEPHGPDCCICHDHGPECERCHPPVGADPGHWRWLYPREAAP